MKFFVSCAKGLEYLLADELLALGCTLGQGYLFARPQSFADLRRTAREAGSPS